MITTCKIFLPPRAASFAPQVQSCSSTRASSLLLARDVDKKIRICFVEIEKHNSLKIDNVVNQTRVDARFFKAG